MLRERVDAMLYDAHYRYDADELRHAVAACDVTIFATYRRRACA